MCRSLTEKERQLVELRERMDEKIGLVQREHNQEKIRLEQDRSTAVTDRDLARYQEPVPVSLEFLVLIYFPNDHAEPTKVER